MSALAPRADMCSAPRDVRFGPIATHAPQQTLLDHLIGARESEFFGGAEVDHGSYRNLE
jgi:hypothetical protein